jgi:polysaccharide export outer membrane protein
LKAELKCNYGDQQENIILMHKSSLKIASKFVSAVLILVLIASCAPIKKSKYLISPEQKELIDTSKQIVFFVEDETDDLIREGDELYIRVTSSDEGPTNFSNSMETRIYDVDLLSYTVDEAGFVKLPYIQRVRLSGLSLQQAADTLEAQLSTYLLVPSVYIKFINNRVTILGEVRNPGVYVFNYKNINIFQAIGYANDITPFGNRENVLVLRKENDQAIKKYIDLTNDEVLFSEWYYVKSNDVIYVEPLARRKWGMETFPYDLLFSAVSTSFLIMTFLVTLYN